MKSVRSHLGRIFVALVLVGLAILYLRWPYDGSTISLSDRFLPPAWMSGGNWSHPLGADNLGRDEVARLLGGARISLTTGVAVVALAGAIGATIGILAGYRGGWLEVALMRATEATFAFPGLLLAVVVLGALGPRQLTIIIVLTALGWMGFARISHDQTVDIRQRPFVKAAEGLGMSWPRVLIRHVLPSQREALVTIAVLEFAGVILAEASLSYLGLGIQPPQSSWGLMVSEGQKYLATAWWLVMWPGLVIALAVVVINQASRSVRSSVDRSRETEAARAWAPRSSSRLTATRIIDSSELGIEPGAVLRVQDLAIAYDDGMSGSTLVLDGIDFCLSRGRALGIVGESGSGKSTLALTLVGLLPPAGRVVGGTVEWCDVSSPTGIGRTAMVFQDPIRSLNPLMRVGQQVAEGLVHIKHLKRVEARERTVELFTLVGLRSPRECLDKYPHELSGGMCQRVMIAMAIALEPDVLIADEPTSALDVTIQAQILDLLHDLRERLNMSLLLITHDFGVVAGSCDDVMVIQEGVVVEHGTVDEVLLAPVHHYTKSLLSCVPRLDRQVDRLTTIEADAGA